MGDATENLHAAMVDGYETAKSELGYSANFYLRMISEHGAVETCRRLLHSKSVSDGFITLVERRRFDLTVEALVIDTRFAGLFTDEEQEIARRRLESFGYRDNT